MKKLFLSILIFVFLFSFVFAQDTFNNGANQQRFSNSYSGINSYQYNEPSFNQLYSSDSSTFWPLLNNMQNGQCEATSDFFVAIPPLGCTPSVVRSDLLEEQNVPVFCQLSAVRINPLIKVSSIKSISFKGEYPEEVAGISFHPARAAIRSQTTLLNNPLMNNIGYVVIILKKNPKEKEMVDWVQGNLTATIYYDIDNAYGTGQGEYYLPIVSDEEWAMNYEDSSFWQGRGFIRILDIDENGGSGNVVNIDENGNEIENVVDVPSEERVRGNGAVKLALYKDRDTVIQTITLNEGETSNKIYFPGYYCKAGLRVKLNNIVAPGKTARISVDGDSLWVSEGARILNDKCRVSKINIVDQNAGSVELSCTGQRVTLLLSRKGADISINGEVEQEFKVGQVITETEDGKVYLGFLGYAPSNIINSKGENFAVFVVSKNNLKDSELVRITQRIEEISKNKEEVDWNSFESQLNGLVGEKVIVKKANDVSFTVGTKQIGFIGNSFGLTSEDYSAQLGESSVGEVIEGYYKETDNAIEEIVDNYPLEKRVFEPASYAEEALYAQADLARKLGKQEDERNYLRIFVELYHDSFRMPDVESRLGMMSNFDFTKSEATIYVANEYHYIGLEKLKDSSLEDKSVSLLLYDAKNRLVQVSVGEGEKVNFNGSKIIGEKEDFLYISKIDVDNVQIEYREYNLTGNGRYSVKNLGERSYLYEGNSVSLSNGGRVVISNLNVKKAAYLSLIPEIDNTKTEANFTFKVGIEKRAIELSPNKTKEMIENLNKTIQQWEKINKDLTKVLKVWKGACFATSGLLMLKNLASGFSGESIARQKVMAAYKQKCNELVDKKQYSSNTECYNALSTNINSDVGAMTSSINNINNKIKDVEKNYMSSSGLLGTEQVIDGEKALEEYKRRYGADSIQIRDKNGNLKTISVSQLESWDEVKALELSKELQEKGVAVEAAQQDAQSLLQYALKRSAQKEEVATAESRIKNYLGEEVDVLYLDEQQQEKLWGGKKMGSGILSQINGIDGISKEGLNENTPVQVVRYNGSDYLIVLEGNANSNVLHSRNVFEINNGKLGLTNKDAEKYIQSRYAFAGSQDCKNKYLSPRVRFYESGEESALPEVVPFDLTDGWYVKVPSSSGTIASSGKKGYAESGDVLYFYICNVGQNGIENSMGGDDICQSFNVNNYDEVSSFGGCALKPSEVQDLARRARSAVKEAASKYAAGQRSYMSIGNNKGEIKVDPPSTNSNSFECQDFMSPEDCQTLFNVCDPVICPASRCDLGGKYPVSNVVQSGIIGSLVLCLPNYKQGILVPVCLTGIQAGIDALVSILKSEMQCLQRSLETGEHVGICDEVTSIYLCEFFWRQIAPLAKVVIPQIIEMAYGTGTRGGGEYMTMTSAWDNLQSSITYFKDDYAQSSFRAFQYRSVNEVGGDFCKAFIGTSIPSSGELLDNLLAPESPEQFYANFQEIPFTEATVPATSQYKVYFHIYAGRDIGAQYSVYLKNPPASGYYAANPELFIKAGYVAKGESADEAVDFTAPSGYKELCVVINAQEHCGFGQVTSDLGLEYVNSKFVEEEASNMNVKTEQECISGNPSVYKMINPNLQAGIEGTINPEIDKKGIVRICSSENPGVNDKTGNGSGRWIDVGYCNNVELRCWLDQASVKDDLKLAQAIDGTISGMENFSNSLMEEGTMSEQQTAEELTILRKKVADLQEQLDVVKLRQNEYNLINYINEQVNDTIVRLEGISGSNGKFGRGYLEADKAEAIKLRREVYALIASNLWEVYKRTDEKKKDVVNTGRVTPRTADSTVAVPVVSGVTEEEKGNELVVFFCDGKNGKLCTGVFGSSLPTAFSVDSRNRIVFDNVVEGQTKPIV